MKYIAFSHEWYLEAIGPVDDVQNCCKDKKVPYECWGYCKRKNKTALSRSAVTGICGTWFETMSECQKGILDDLIFWLQILTKYNGCIFYKWTISFLSIIWWYLNGKNLLVTFHNKRKEGWSLEIPEVW